LATTPRQPARFGRLRSRAALLLGLLGLSLPAPACSGPSAPDSDALAILFVGNSLTFFNDLPGMLASLLEGADVGAVVVESVAMPNYGLEDHWADGIALDRIRQGGWDVVVMQQGPSATEGRPSLLEYSQRFADEMAKTGARPALFMVWPAASRFFDFDGVSDSYATAARQVGGLLFPAGEAWRKAWAQSPDLALYGGDGFHPSVLGSYLAALVMYEQLSGKSAIGLPAEIRVGSSVQPLDAALAALLQEAAHEANRDFALAPARAGRQ